ncbi:hypothetical protein MU582_18515 [Nocardioidaceae bacterium SCSIO 66511]|nr:hypothetical protein MU582_18515 [Nocardioidaceae bacterium SCSIO 66511]
MIRRRHPREVRRHSVAGWRIPIATCALAASTGLASVATGAEADGDHGTAGSPTHSAAPPRGTFDPGQLTATDDLGRSVSEPGEVPKPREDRYVGLFYFLWLGQHGKTGPYNITKILEEHPEAVHDPDHPAWGPPGAHHHWGEPLYDYYFSDDAWVLRKHAQMLAAAKVDFLYFDVTNAFTYKSVYDRLLEVFDDVRQQGWDVPQVVFYTNSSSGATIQKLYDDLYEPGRYRELWFELDGKPMIIGNPDEVSTEIRDFFTWRRNQWPNEPKKEGGFPWISFERPQDVFMLDGKPDIVNVAAAVHNNFPFSDQPFYGAGNNWSRSFHDGALDTSPGAYKWGNNFSEQWERALQVDPRIVAVTGWNEWVAQRLGGDFPGWDNKERPADRPIFFVDQATTEFSRDVEPMKGGYNDNYYLQLVDYIRRYKGVAPAPGPSKRQRIDIDGDFSQWDTVRPSYRDFVGDTQPRSHEGFGGITYKNNSGRNDIDEVKVARDSRNISFYMRTVDPIIGSDKGRWMTLYLNVDGNDQNGWEGYDFAINRRGVDNNTTSLEAARSNGTWKQIRTVRYRTDGNELQLSVPRKPMGPKVQGTLHLEFKVADNVPNSGDVMDFYTGGDAAPDGRFTYLFDD